MFIDIIGWMIFRGYSLFLVLMMMLKRYWYDDIRKKYWYNDVRKDIGMMMLK